MFFFRLPFFIMATKYSKNIEKLFTDLTTINYMHLHLKNDREREIKNVLGSKSCVDDDVERSLVVDDDDEEDIVDDSA